MVQASGLTAILLEAQKADGGWGYQGSLSWTEPTAFALLALAALDLRGAAYEQGIRWLLSRQRPDGGWPPNAQVPLTNAVTGNAVLALSGLAARPCLDGGIDWLLTQIGPELTAWERFQYWWQDRPQAETVMGGSPWFPGTASWVSPTVMTVLSFSRIQKQGVRRDLVPHIEKAKQYLLSRRCQRGGWNHGGGQLYSEQAAAYPEMTGMALLAFDHPEYAKISHDLALAEQMLAAPQSAEGQSWLMLALAKHGRPARFTSESLFPCRTVRDISLQILARQALPSRNAFLVQTT